MLQMILESPDLIIKVHQSPQKCLTFSLGMMTMHNSQPKKKKKKKAL